MQDYQPKTTVHTDQIKHNTDHHREDLASFITATYKATPHRTAQATRAALHSRRRWCRVQGVIDPKGHVRTPVEMESRSGTANALTQWSSLHNGAE